MAWVVPQSCGGEPPRGHAQIENREGLGRGEGEGYRAADDRVELVADLACHLVESIFALLGWIVGVLSLVGEMGVGCWVGPALGVVMGVSSGLEVWF